MSEQPTALRLADALNCATDDDCGYCQPCVIAAELRRLHEEITALRAALAAVRFQCEADSKTGEWTTPISRVLELIDVVEGDKS